MRGRVPSRLCAICDAEACARAGWLPEHAARAFLEGGARFIQLRAKRLSSGDFLRLIDAVMGVAEPLGASVVVNDRVDLARLGAATGVHVGQDDISPRVARELLGAKAIVGLSTHTTAQLETARSEPVSYVAVGPVFGTATKDTGYEAVGLAAIAVARRILPDGIPVLAIGGITIERAADALAAGASAVAVISDLLSAGDPADRVRAYLKRLGTVSKV